MKRVAIIMIVQMEGGKGVRVRFRVAGYTLVVGFMAPEKIRGRGTLMPANKTILM